MMLIQFQFRWWKQQRHLPFYSRVFKKFRWRYMMFKTTNSKDCIYTCVAVSIYIWWKNFTVCQVSCCWPFDMSKYTRYVSGNKFNKYKYTCKVLTERLTFSGSFIWYCTQKVVFSQLLIDAIALKYYQLHWMG